MESVGVRVTNGSLQSSQNSHSHTEYESSDYNETDSDSSSDIDVNWKELVCVKRIKNAKRNSVTLPPEILLEIFSRYRPRWNPDSPSGHDNCRACNHYSWRTITHVCHRWREVALCSRTFWNKIHIHSSSRFPALMVERSGETALHIRVCDEWRSEQAKARISSLLKVNLYRIRTINFTCRDDGDLWSFRHVMAGNPAPLLEGIVADFRTHALNCGSPFTGSLDQIMPVAPNLRILAVESMIVEATWRRLPSCLTKLKIEADRIHGVQTAFLGGILSMLERVPSLQDLELVDCGSIGGDSLLSLPVVPLSSLRYLRLSIVNAHRLTQLLSRLSIPSTVTMKIHTEYTVLNEDLATIIGTRIAFTNTALAAHFDFGLGEFAKESVSMRFWEENHEVSWTSFERHYRKKPARLDITIDKVPMKSRSHHLDSLWRFSRSLPIDCVENAGFTNFPRFGRGPLILSFMSSMPNIRVLNIDGPYRENLVLMEGSQDFDVGSQSSSDSVILSHSQPMTSPSRIFPQLERIAFDLTSSNKRWVAGSEGANEFVRDLGRLLRTRQDGGAGVKEVWFYGTGESGLDLFYVARAPGFDDITRLTKCSYLDAFTYRLEGWPEEDDPVEVCGTPVVTCQIGDSGISLHTFAKP